MTLTMWTTLSFVLVLNVVIGTVKSFDPGCSFIAGQCMYNVKLGHAGQCDTPALRSSSSTSSSSGCCDELSTKYSQLNDDLDKLKTQVDVLTTMMVDSSKNMSGLEAELQKALTERDDIVMVLTRKESELNSTRSDLANVMAKAGKEIQDLHNSLSSVRNSYSTCQSALSGVGSTTSGQHSDTQTGDYSVVYYNFNQAPKDFTFPESSYHQKMELLNHGSSSTTGPRVEHSWGVSAGSYLGINARTVGDKMSYHRTSKLQAESGTFQPANAYCIMFWYYMEGRDVKTLTANIEINGGAGYPIFTKSGPVSSHRWELAQIDLDSEYTQYQFKIDFTMSTEAYYTYSSGRHVLQNVDGDIAVDDLYVYNTTCSSIPRHPQSESFSHDNVTSYYTFHLTPMTWTDAYDVCRREGPWSALVSVESAAEHTALVNMIRSNNAYTIVGGQGFFTSGTDVDSEHRFAWTNTGVTRAITLDNWHAGQPNNVAGNQDCLLMEYPNDNFKWGDVNCNTKHPFICEVEVPDQANNKK